MADRQVDRQRRVDEVLHFKKDQVAYNIRYEGRAASMDAAESASIWQVKRVTLDAGVETTLYANNGKYNARWDQRSTYFPAVPAPGASASGTSQIIRATATVAWTAYPTVAGARIETLLIEHDTDNPGTRRLWVAYDGAGVNYTVLRPGDSLEFSPKDKTQVFVRTAVNTSLFSLWLNHG